MTICRFPFCVGKKDWSPIEARTKLDPAILKVCIKLFFIPLHTQWVRNSTVWVLGVCLVVFANRFILCVIQNASRKTG